MLNLYIIRLIVLLSYNYKIFKNLVLWSVKD